MSPQCLHSNMDYTLTRKPRKTNAFKKEKSVGNICRLSWAVSVFAPSDPSDSHIGLQLVGLLSQSQTIHGQTTTTTASAYADFYYLSSHPCSKTPVSQLHPFWCTYPVVPLPRARTITPQRLCHTSTHFPIASHSHCGRWQLALTVF